jgi:hypothetical protein
MTRLVLLTLAGLLLMDAHAFAQSASPSADVDHAVVFELGWEGDWSKTESLHQGGTFAFEVTPIEHWLELECGVSAIHEAAGAEIPIDFLLKKPWRISRTVEFMAGVGPELIHSTAEHQTFWGASGVADLMVWPRQNVGWYLEPGVERTFQPGNHQTGLAMAAGLILGR